MRFVIVAYPGPFFFFFFNFFSVFVLHVNELMFYQSVSIKK